MSPVTSIADGVSTPRERSVASSSRLADGAEVAELVEARDRRAAQRELAVELPAARSAGR